MSLRCGGGVDEDWSMPGISTPLLPLAFLADLGVAASLALVAGGGAIVFLWWRLWRERRDYALELADQVRLLAEEQEKTALEQRAKDEIARESQAKTEMLATLSREIRAHLNGVIGSADLMLDHTLRPQQREHLTTLRSSAESLHQSLNDVLDYATIETGRIKISHAPFDLRQPLIEVVEILSAPAQLKGLELVLIVAPDVPLAVAGDAQRLRQVLFKLMSNAVKFAPGGRIVLRAEVPGHTTPLVREGGSWLQFSVTDSGEGIPEEMQAALFERSAGDDSSSPRKYGGSGLELAISKRLVELMGGQIGARRLPENGSEFWVVLPLEAEKNQPAPIFTPPIGLHVVVLDRDTASRVAASAMLTRLGVAQDATDLVADAAMLLRDALEENARDLVLLVDEEIARGEGAALAAVFAGDPALRATRVVLMSRAGGENGNDDYNIPIAALVQKPLLRVEHLVAALQT
jgi:two-component system sensor histidine kinase/response regulator